MVGAGVRVRWAAARVDDPAQVASVAAMMDDKRQEHGMSEQGSRAFTEHKYTDRWGADGPVIVFSVDHDASDPERTLAAIDEVAGRMKEQVRENAAAWERGMA